ncbi:cell wall hydrolase [Paenibacillus crassostreae]|uniref:Cell wall hydrolase SleB domain-containing protein n=1 Tax=Paenibacillus crassostreae TaxID=1763538 RepID=A0A162N776_9BACL|nr:cell wall hydrolase [Paenibacillus crassostreae]AOZ92327.1 hypothetical protein LPB68_08855 [Paenibacillus crassostreae]OAB71042.1 hypothetical protein PNBC_21005 [Paenibacillus crassostreae]
MNMIRQNRWIALLIGVILVCFSAISFMMQVKQDKDEGKTYRQFTIKDTEEYMFKPMLAVSFEDKETFYSSISKDKKSLLTDTKDLEVDSTLMNKSVKTDEVTEIKAVTEVTEKSEDMHEVNMVNTQLIPPNVIFFTRTQMLSQNEQEQSTWQYAVTDKELLMLRKIVMAEAEGEPYEGKIAVTNVVLNRLRSANFPNTIDKVIHQKYQFSPVANGRFDRVVPNEDAIHAVNEALNGRKEVSDDTYYFLSLQLADDLTVHHTRTFSRTIGNHSFYK